MRRLVYLFLSITAIGLLIAPVANLGLQDKWTTASLYSLDPLLPWVARPLYQAGISISPKQVVIGRNDWLYLGDQYEAIITQMRDGAPPGATDIAKKIAQASDAWSKFLQARGVRAYRIMLGSEKPSVYPEFLPKWARVSNGPSSTDVVMASASAYVDTRPALRAAKERDDYRIYLQTDTHWTSYGAWLAFRALTQEIDRLDPGLRWPELKDVKRVVTAGNDLAHLLRLDSYLTDQDALPTFDQKVDTIQTDYATGNVIMSGGNPGVMSQSKLLRVTSPDALNNRRVLWLRDSFGIAVSPYMALSFKETLQIHWSRMTPADIARIVNEYHPDYVIVTFAERWVILSDWFQRYPPTQEPK